MTQPCTEKHRLQRIEDKQDRILNILEGNGKEGVVTKVAVHRTWFKMTAYIGGPILVGVAVRTVWALMK
jgi:hypothetical protein